jgi:signal transduction histidine kinase
MEASLQRQPHDLGALLAEAVDKFRSQADAKGHTLVLHEPDGGPSVNIDAARIGQVLQNLVGNAIKYTPDGGEISVSTRQDRDEIWIQIEDTGLGIPEEELPRIFDKFYRVQTKDRQDIQGNGLGLAIVKAVVEEHGGTVHVESEVGQGSCFSFCLPLASTPEPEQEKIPA